MGDRAECRGVECIQLFHLNDGVNPLPDFVEAVESLEKLIATFSRVVVHIAPAAVEALQLLQPI